MYYLNCFFIYSILGFILETILSYITKSGFTSGILYGPWTPIYGIGTVVILLLSNYFFMNLHISRWKETIIVFFIVAIFLSCLELLGGLFIEKVFKVIFWSYDDHKYNIGKYISIEMALVWGITSIIFIYIVNPFMKKIIIKTPSFITILIGIMMFIDFIVTFYKGFKK